ncbi:MAG: DUF5340 family protein [Cyanobacteria bacterium P01_H01_bin.121]
MASVPLPSHIHYELLLQLLEQQTMHALSDRPQHRNLTHELIVTLRKALVQQQRLEELCESTGLAVEYRWSLNGTEAPQQGS